MGHRRQWLLWILATGLTALLCAAVILRAEQLQMEGGLLPSDHPYAELDREITAGFGMELPVVWLLVARQDTVWTPDILARAQKLTREVVRIPGVIATDVVSIASPNLRDVVVDDAGLRSVYLMPTVPASHEEVAALRRRVEGDPNYRGTLVSEDGAAVMIVASFRGNTDPAPLVKAALALKREFTDNLTTGHVIAEPVLAAALERQAGRAALWLAAVVAAWLVALALALGTGAAATFLGAALLSVAAAVALTALFGSLSVWTLLAVPAVALGAGILALAPRSSRLAATLGLLAFALALVGLSPPPARSIGITCGLGFLAAGAIAAGLGRTPPAPARIPFALRLVAAALLVGAAVGLPRLETSLGTPAFGARYLPGEGAADLRVLRRHFPPPTTLAVRLRGERGFITAPAVLTTIDRLMLELGEDPAVVRALSIAFIVKTIHWAFNEKAEGYFSIPEDRDLVARYLALAYSPAFRRFLDRSLQQSVFWIYVAGDRFGDVSRVFAALEERLRQQPIPGAEVDLVAGDGATLLVAGRALARASAAAAFGLLLLGVAVALRRGVGSGVRALLGGIAAGVTGIGIMGWIGLPLDFVSFAGSLGLAVGGGLIGMLSREAPGVQARLALAFAAAGLLCIIVPQPPLQLCGALGLGVSALACFPEP